jgi:predicted metal-dependent enzyme (double-stranded beta helix superfamily)
MTHTILEPLPEDQWFIESQELRSFVATVREISVITPGDRSQTLARLEPYFQELLAQQEWLTEKFAQINPESKMGGGIGQWLLYRAKDRSLSVFSLVIPPDGDIHAVKTTSQSASVSIHILGNDTGCILRHQFIPESHSVKSFRSGYSNAPCKEEEEKEHVQV